MTVLFAGVGVGDQLAERLPGLDVRTLDASDTDAAREWLAAGEAAVLSLVAYEHLAAEDVPLDLPVVVCLDASTPTEVLRHLTGQGVQRLMFEPVDPDELAREIQRVTGTLQPDSESADQDASVAGEEAVLAEEIAGLWSEFGGTMIARIEVLEEVGTGLFEGDRDPEALDAARTAAHKLYGSLGTFGLDRASEMAAELEALVEAGAATDGEVFRYAELVVALRDEIEHAVDTAQPAAGEAPGPAAPGTMRKADEPVALVALEPHEARAESLTAAALARGWSARVVGDLDDLVEAVDRTRPDVLVLDPAASEPERLRGFLRRLALNPPRVPVVYWSDDADLQARVRAASLGAGAFIERDREATLVIERATELLLAYSRPPATVLVVDDDPALLALTTRALDDDTTRVVSISDPLLFWDALEATCPDLLLLDVDMPHFNGIQLCRVVRASARWAHLPIVFLTAHADRETLTRAFRAGADDYVLKPLHGPELRTRVENRLERVRIHLPGAATGLATGTLARETAAARVALALALARRHDEPLAIALVRAEPGEIDDLRVNLARVTGAIREHARPEDVLARWSSAELLVCLYGMTAPEAAAWVQARIPVSGADAEPIAQVATAAFPEDGGDLQALIRAAAVPTASRERAADTASGPKAETVVAVGGARTERVDVVLVEDDEALAALLLQTMGARDFSTHWIRDGVEAVEALAAERPSVEARVIVLDIGLPGLDGLTVLRRLARSGVTARSRVVMLTARSAEAEVLRSLELGAFDHVPKPFSVAELLHRVRRAMETAGRPA